MSWLTIRNSQQFTAMRHARASQKRATIGRSALEVLEERYVPAYAIIDLGVTAGFVTSYAQAINNSGQVVGYEQSADYVDHAFLWQNGVMQDLGTLGGSLSFANGLNDLGQVVGVSETAPDASGVVSEHAFLWQNGVMTDLGTLGGTYSRAFGINSAGQIVGESTTAGDVFLHAFLWQSGSMIDLGTLPNTTGSSATAINSAAQVVGTADSNSPFLWQNGSMTALDLDGADSGNATTINVAGQVVGYTTFNSFGLWGITDAVLWQNGQIIYLGSLNGNDSFAYGINNVGQVVGMSGDPFLWQNGVMTDLTTEFASGGNPVAVQAINDAGQIVGWSNDHAVLLQPAASLPTLSINNVSVTEGDSGTVNAVFTVRLSAASSYPVTVSFQTADGTATADRDYGAQSGALTFAPGETSKTISVSIIGDRIDEFDETFSVNLSASTNANLGNSQGIGTIVDNDAAPSMTITDASIVEGDSGYKMMVFTVSLSGASEKPIAVNYRTADGSATTADHDYQAQNGTLNFAPGETTKTISIVIYGDRKKEPNETFFINLSSAVNASILDAQAIGTILDDDGGKH